MKSIVRQSKSMLTRKKLANPFSDESIKDRHKKNKSIDLHDNNVIEDLNNGFIKILPIDKNKVFK